MKYLRTFLLALESEFMSRANLVGWFLVLIVPAVVLVLVWFAILGDRESLNGFNRGDFIVYYIFMSISWYIVGGTFGGTTGAGIKNGQINTSLLKPYNVVLRYGVEEQAWKLLSLVMTLPITVTVLFFTKDFIHIKFSLEQIILVIISLLLGGINFAFMEAIVGISAFWVTEVWPLAEVKHIMQSLFGGRLVPLTLMPPAVFFLANVLPFKYMFYVPVSILLDKSQNPLFDISLQALYIVILFTVFKLVWFLGIKRYEGVGA